MRLRGFPPGRPLPLSKGPPIRSPSPSPDKTAGLEAHPARGALRRRPTQQGMLPRLPSPGCARESIPPPPATKRSETRMAMAEGGKRDTMPAPIIPDAIRESAGGGADAASPGKDDASPAGEAHEPLSVPHHVLHAGTCHRIAQRGHGYEGWLRRPRHGTPSPSAIGGRPGDRRQTTPLTPLGAAEKTPSHTGSKRSRACSQA